MLFNIWQSLIQGFLTFLDALLIPMFEMFTTAASGGMPHDSSLAIYFRAAIRLVYPILSTLNFLPFVVAVGPALAIGLARKVLAGYHFLADIVPVTR